MDKRVIQDQHPHWYAIYTHPKQEKRAESNLRAWGVEAFDPLVRERCFRTYSSAPAYVTRQMFPRYIFARFSVRDLLHKVCFTRGVHSVVSFGGEPGPVDDDVIELLRARMGKDGLVEIAEPLESGDTVQIKSGPLANFIGVLDGKINGEQRVSILLATVSYQARVLIEREVLQKIS
jgi:transcriptional antiterminator RfaH